MGWWTRLNTYLLHHRFCNDHIYPLFKKLVVLLYTSTSSANIQLMVALSTADNNNVVLTMSS